MVGRGSDGCSVATITLSTAGVVSVPQVGSRMNLLRCPAKLIFLSRTSGLGNGLFHGRGPCGSHTLETDCVGPDLPAWAGAI